jgi:hypothetical protein
MPLSFVNSPICSKSERNVPGAAWPPIGRCSSIPKASSHRCQVSMSDIDLGRFLVLRLFTIALGDDDTGGFYRADPFPRDGFDFCFGIETGL